MAIDFSNWPHRWLLFKESVSLMSPRGLPSIADFQDCSWARSDKEKLVAYLLAAHNAVTTAPRDLTCLYCGEPVSGDAWCYSDGVWIWTHCLAHYVQEHSIRLPDAFVQHIMAKRYDPKGWNGQDWRKLDWPRQD